MNPRRIARLLTRRVPPQARAGARRAVVRARHVPLTERDIVLASYPKSGSTWLRFVLISALTDRDVDFDNVRRISPPLGGLRGAEAIVPGGGRLVKSHDLPVFAPVGSRPRAIHLVRDGRDVAVSYFHHRTRKGLAPPTMDEYLDAFLRGDSGPFGSWQRHSLAWRDEVAAHPTSAVTIRYEDLRADPAATVLGLSDRFGLGLDAARVEQALTANDTSRMRAKESSSQWLAENSADRSIAFVRAGRTGDWRETFDDAALARFRREAGEALTAFGYPLD